MKINGARRALVLADAFNLLVAIYLIVIAIVSLVKLRWYHQLTIAVKTRHVITSATSYFAFFILLFAGVILIAIFLVSTIRLNPIKIYISPSAEQQTQVVAVSNSNDQTQATTSNNLGEATSTKQRLDSASNTSNLTSNGRFSPLIIRDTTSPRAQNQSAVCCSILLHLLAGISLIIVLVLWLLNTGELVRDSISTQLEYAFARYQFSNRSNHYSVAIDGMQDINHCCGSLDYIDFPHQRTSGLSSGHYPGSCCGKSIFGVNARVMCTPEEIVRNRQTTGCTTMLSNYYDLISLLVVPVALVSLFVNITIISLIVIAKGHADALDFEAQQTPAATNRDHQLVDMTSPKGKFGPLKQSSAS